MTKKVRCLIARVGLDIHDFGAKVVASALKDAGLEVIYASHAAQGLTPSEVAEIAVQEDVDLVGLSNTSGAHLVVLPECVTLLKQRGKGDIPIIAGGVIPKGDIPFLKNAGIIEVFGPGTTTKSVVDFIRRYFRVAK